MGPDSNFPDGDHRVQDEVSDKSSMRDFRDGCVQLFCNRVGYLGSPGVAGHGELGFSG